MIMTTKYQEYTAEQVIDFFGGMNGFYSVKIPKTKEIVFERITSVPNVMIRVYSSVAYGTTRAVGTDAGRVVLYHVDGGILWKGKRVHRTKNFLTNLQKRCRDAWTVAKSLPRCPRCGDFMGIRTNKKTKQEFFGCRKYPICNGARRMVPLKVVKS
jgi:hypothetical protein